LPDLTGHFQWFPGLRRLARRRTLNPQSNHRDTVMGRWIAAGMLALIVCTDARAGVAAQFRHDCIGAPQLMQACEARWVEECSKRWDAAMNMSKGDYDRACRRIARERAQFLSDEFLSKLKKD
jgi:hypothetical protein